MLLLPSIYTYFFLFLYTNNRTPYCDCSGAPATEAPLKPINPKDNIMPRLKKKKRGS